MGAKSNLTQSSQNFDPLILVDVRSVWETYLAIRKSIRGRNVVHNNFPTVQNGINFAKYERGNHEDECLQMKSNNG